eukprot:TRINITY_DN14070_c0_g1_i1.p1 TRINITY_DN14070_c0_g1~~TRINITY_DN14070_c0_g1_i1.p1  ORF type:complete len:1085 (-),score=249.23 TRINITY_DN14070_c0_g1_i1:65-3319(-)
MSERIHAIATKVMEDGHAVVSQLAEIAIISIAGTPTLTVPLSEGDRQLPIKDFEVVKRHQENGEIVVRIKRPYQSQINLYFEPSDKENENLVNKLLDFFYEAKRHKSQNDKENSHQNVKSPSRTPNFSAVGQNAARQLQGAGVGPRAGPMKTYIKPPQKVNWLEKRNEPQGGMYGSTSGYSSVSAPGAKKPEVSRRGNAIVSEEDFDASNPTNIFKLTSNTQSPQNRGTATRQFSYAPARPPALLTTGSSTSPSKGSSPAKPLSYQSSSASTSTGIYKQQKLSLGNLTSGKSSYYSPKVSSSYSGFKNVGNSCYMGATLRALMSVHSFVTDLGHKRIMDLDELAEDSFYRAFLSLTDVATDEKRKDTIDPTPVKSKLGRHFRMFLGAQQQDSHEFFMDCLLQLETDIFPHLRLLRAEDVSRKVLKAQKKLKDVIKTSVSGNKGKAQAKKVAARKRGRQLTDDSDLDATQDTSATEEPAASSPVEGEEDDLWEKFADEGDMLDFETMYCPSRRNFGGVLENTIVCRECKHSRSKNEAFKCLSVEVFDKAMLESVLDSMKDQTNDEEEKDRLEQAKPKEQFSTVSNLLDLFFSQEIVEARCEKCECKEAVIVRRILRPPRVLVVHLKRFSQTETGRGIKVHEEVEIDQALNLSKHIVEDLDVYQRPIPYDASDFKDFEKNRKKRLEAMNEKSKSKATSSGIQPKITGFTSASAASSSASPAKKASDSKPSSTNYTPASVEPAPKRRKISDDESDAAPTAETKPSLDAFDFTMAEQEATQPDVTDLPSKPSLFHKNQKSSSSKSHVLVEGHDPAFYDGETQMGSHDDKPAPAKKPIDLFYDQDDEDDKDAEERQLQAAIAASKAEAEAAAKQMEPEDYDEQLRLAMERSKKEAENQDDDGSEEIYFPGRGSGSAQGNEDNRTLGELAKDHQMDIDIQEETQPLDDVPTEDAPTPPLSPRDLEEYREFVSKPHPGDCTVFPEYGRPDPFEDDELRHSPQLKATSKGSRDCSYGLLSIIHHIGSSSSHGHYVTDVYNAEQKIWTHHDDSRVETHKDAADTFLKSPSKRRGAYLLFYVNKALQTASKSSK